MIFIHKIHAFNDIGGPQHGGHVHILYSMNTVDNEMILTTLSPIDGN